LDYSGALVPNSIQKWELDFISTFQKTFSHDFFKIFFKIGSSLADEIFFILLFPFVWIFLNRRAAVELIFLFCETSLILGVLKWFFAMNRPFHFIDALKIGHGSGYGFPSGHSMAAVVLWAFMARRFRLTGGYKLVAFIALWVGASRVYLGVHFPHDVVAGWITGAIMFCTYVMELKQFKVKEIAIPVWAAKVSAVALAALYLRPHPETVANSCVLAGLMLALLVFPLAKRSAVNSFSLRVRVMFYAIAVLGLLNMEFMVMYLFPQAMTFSVALKVIVTKYILMAFWLCAELPLFLLQKLKLVAFKKAQG